MTYDLTNPLHRKQFVARANKLLKKHCKVARLEDGSTRTIKQNSYLHVIIRILAIETGVSEQYAKDTYFKTMSNKDLFQQTKTDPMTGEEITFLRGTEELSVDEMATAIEKFRHWSEDNGYYLPEAHSTGNGDVEFTSNEEKEAFEQAKTETERLNKYI